MTTPPDPYREAQLRADRAAQAWGTQAPGPLQGESLAQYQVRLLTPHQAHDPAWKDANLNKIAADPASLRAVETQVLESSYRAGNNPVCPPGTPLTAHSHTDSSGRRITTFRGDPVLAWAPFQGPGVRYLVGIDKHPPGARRG
jgi:hypothetical protein